MSFDYSAGKSVPCHALITSKKIDSDHCKIKKSNSNGPILFYHQGLISINSRLESLIKFVHLHAEKL